MKRLTIICAFITVTMSGSSHTSAAMKLKTIHYFYAVNCESCRNAAEHFRKPAGIKDGTAWTYGNLSIVPHTIIDQNNSRVGTNIALLVAMCRDIEKKLGRHDFVYYGRDTYEFHVKDGIPRYRKDDRYTRTDEAFPTPVFIIGDRVVLGFNTELINRAAATLK